MKGTVPVIYAGKTTAVAFLYVHTFRLKTEKNYRHRRNYESR